jgi:hypothetical protein
MWLMRTFTFVLPSAAASADMRVELQPTPYKLLSSCRARYADATQWSTAMNIPHYINENKSDMRGIKAWVVHDAQRRQSLFRAVLQPRGVPQQWHSAKEIDIF